MLSFLSVEYYCQISYVTEYLKRVNNHVFLYIIDFTVPCTRMTYMQMVCKPLYHRLQEMISIESNTVYNTSFVLNNQREKNRKKLLPWWDTKKFESRLCISFVNNIYIENHPYYLFLSMRCHIVNTTETSNDTRLIWI